MAVSPLLHKPCWYDGQWLTGGQLGLMAEDPGLCFGATLFTTLRIWQGSLHQPQTLWLQHRQRLQQSVNTFHWSEPDWSRVEAGATALASHYPVLRITLFPNGRELITGRDLPQDLPQWSTRGVVAWVASTGLYTRPLPAHKTGNYLPCWLARQAAQRHQAQEAILVSGQGHWLETSTGNLWGWNRGKWWTPPLQAGILPGVMRSHLLRQLEQQGKRALKAAWLPDQALRFEALAYSNSVMGVVPIRRILIQRTTLEYDAYHPSLTNLKALAELD